MQTAQEPPYPLATRPTATSTGAWIPPPQNISLISPQPQSPRSTSPYLPMPPRPSSGQDQLQQQQLQQLPQRPMQSYSPQPPQPSRQSQNPSSSSLGSVSSMSLQSNTSRPVSANSVLPPSPLAPPQRTSHRKMTAGSSPLATSPLALATPVRPSRIKPKVDMPSSLPPESVCECFLCHTVSPYNQRPPPEILAHQRQELSRLAPTCPSIHLYCLASRLPMTLPLDTTQKSPLTRSILDYFYSTWIPDELDQRGPRVQCLNFIPIHPLTASSFDRYLESQSWDKRVCRPLWHATDLRCKLGLEGMYRNCMQDKCDSCFIFNDGYEHLLSKDKLVYLSPNSSRAHDQLMATRALTSGSKKEPVYDPENRVQCVILTFAALGRVYDVPSSSDKMKRPPKGWDVVRREVCNPNQAKQNGSTAGEEYGVFAADAMIPLAMVLYKVV
ncbi:hypothetical protein EMPS_02727 [Entomortierella parvispora]|uniref:Uncharacterized protein n=1 Tax=Entomortierella parvispora TaxID=205924 RepID=A0A9P3H605_9FUNG|nr:hypothetical protein EMPS_02727 [Entomortierella parvispora]